MARVRSRSYQRPVNPAQDFSDWYVVAPTSAPCGATSPVNLVCMQYIRFTSWLPPPQKKMQSVCITIIIRVLSVSVYVFR